MQGKLCTSAKLIWLSPKAKQAGEASKHCMAEIFLVVEKRKQRLRKGFVVSSMLKERCDRGRREREEDEMVFSEGERDDDRLKRGSKDKKVNTRSRKQKKKSLMQTAIFAWLTFVSCRIHEKEESE